jgi:SAM-dependent methyltransferase
MEAEWIDLPTASVDGVLSRWGYMLLADPETALRETRRVLRPGRSLVLAAWAAAQDNPWMSAIGMAMVEVGAAEPPQPGAPGPFAFADPARIEDLLSAAGFDDIEIEPVDFVFPFASGDAHFEHQAMVSPTLQEQLAGLSPAQHTALRDAIDARLEPHRGPDGSLRLPARTWVASASA